MSLRELLKRISAIESTLSSATAKASRNRLTADSSHLTIPTLLLDTCKSDLERALVNNGVESRITSVAASCAEKMASHYEEAFEKVCIKLVKTPLHPEQRITQDFLSNLRLMYEARYSKQVVGSILQGCLNAQKVLNTPADNARVHERPTFNYRSTPLLEKYFEFNAYPSASDRLVLARKTSMTPRQIEVWFQNHRNRSKRDGTTLTRWSANMPVRTPLERLDEFEMPLKDDVVASGAKRNTPSPPSNLLDDLAFKRPIHAFPASFSLNCDHGCFPPIEGPFKFPPPIWRRTVSQPKTSPQSPDMDSFITLFATKLHLRDNRHSPKSATPWFFSTTVMPPPAPHPSLIRSTWLYYTRQSVESRRMKKPPAFVERRPTSSLPSTNAPVRRSSASSSWSSISTSSSRVSSSSSFSSIDSDPPCTPRSAAFELAVPTLSQHDLLSFDTLLGFVNPPEQPKTGFEQFSWGIASFSNPSVPSLPYIPALT